VDYFRRVWGVYSDLQADAGSVYEQLSDVLHARGPLIEMAKWESTHMCEAESKRFGDVVSAVTKGIQLSLVQIFGSLATHALQIGKEDAARAMCSTPFMSTFKHSVPWIMPALFPLTPHNLSSGGIPESFRVARRFIERQGPGEAELLFWFMQQRFRAVELAREGYLEEEKLLGVDYAPASVTGFEELVTIVGEMAALLGGWLDNAPEGPAFAVASSAARSAFSLWLEDDDRAMIPTRTMLECVAQVRTWRTRPDRAARLVNLGRPRPRDWFEACGWKRLRVFVNALSELAHFRIGVRWSGAVAGLGTIASGDLPNPQEGPQRGRGTAFRRVLLLLAAEEIQYLERMSENLAWSYRDLVEDRSQSKIGADLEEWLDRLWSQRGMDFGPGDFVGADVRCSRDAPTSAQESAW
jgi:hypothetical protein